jgi:hypothetical protein
VAERARNFLKRVGRSESRYGQAYTNGDMAEARAKARHEEPPHSVKQHPDDPQGAFEDAATEIVDPEEIRRKAARFGKAGQAIDPEVFDPSTRALYRAVHDTRIGAITIPGQRQAGEQLKVVESTEAAIAAIQAEGSADATKAERLETAVIPRVEREREAAAGEVKEADLEVKRAREDRARVREEEQERMERKKAERPRPSLGRWQQRSARNMFSRVRLSPGKAWLTFAFEVLGSGYLLAPNVADVIGTDFWTGFLISLVISIAMLSAALAAGIGLAAIRLPGWVVGGATVTAFGAILVKFVPALDALRLAGESGIETLTAATLGAFLIAMVSGYALAVEKDDQATVATEDEEADLLKKAGSPLQDAGDVLDEAQTSKRAAEEEEDRCVTLLRALWEKVEKLRDNAVRSAVAAEERRGKGVEAEVEVETIQATTQSAIEQEESAAEWAYLIAIAAHEKARVEELPDAPTPVADTTGPPPERGPEGLSTLRKLALLVAAASGLSSLALGLVPLGIGIPLAALMVALDRHSKASADDAIGGGAPIDRHPRVVAAADGDNPLYRYQPDHMVPKYGDGGAGAGEHR